MDDKVAQIGFYMWKFGHSWLLVHGISTPIPIRHSADDGEDDVHAHSSPPHAHHRSPLVRHVVGAEVSPCSYAQDSRLLPHVDFGDWDPQEERVAWWSASWTPPIPCLSLLAPKKVTARGRTRGNGAVHERVPRSCDPSYMLVTAPLEHCAASFLVSAHHHHATCSDVAWRLR